MASAGRRSELRALVFDPQYIQFKPNGACVILYFVIIFHPRVHAEYWRPNQVNDLWYIPAVLTRKPDFGAPNCPGEGARLLSWIHD